MLQEIGSMLIDRREFFLQLSLEHLLISLVAISISIVIGGIIGIFISERQIASKPVLGMINFLYTIPSISMLGFLIPFSGIGNTTAIIALTLYALLPMVRNTYTGITTVNDQLIEAAKGMGSTDFQILFKIKLPLALPVIMSGIRNMVIMTIALTGIASFIGAGGLGVAIYRGITTNNTIMTVTGSLLIALMALVLDFLLGRVEKAVNYKTKSKKTRKIPFIILGVSIVILLVFAILSNRSEKNTLQIATKPMTEQYIIGEMLDLLIEKNTDINVNITQGVGGGTSNIQPAMESGEFDLYPEYTGTGWNQVLKNKTLYTEDAFDELQQQYQDNYNMTWKGMYGFNNSYALAVRKELTEKNDLKKISDLQGISNDLVFGAEYDFFEREDGYTPLTEKYQLQFARTVDLDIGLKYQAIQEGDIDIMPIFTTDGQFSISDLVILEDDLNFYPSYRCGNIIRNEILEAHPELEKIFEEITGILSDTEMAQLNYEVEENGKNPRDVAEQFLKDKGLWEEK